MMVLIRLNQWSEKSKDLNLKRVRKSASFVTLCELLICKCYI